MVSEWSFKEAVHRRSRNAKLSLRNVQNLLLASHEQPLALRFLRDRTDFGSLGRHQTIFLLGGLGLYTNAGYSGSWIVTITTDLSEMSKNLLLASPEQPLPVWFLRDRTDFGLFSRHRTIFLFGGLSFYINAGYSWSWIVTIAHFCNKFRPIRRSAGLDSDL